MISERCPLSTMADIELCQTPWGDRFLLGGSVRTSNAMFGLIGLLLAACATPAPEHAQPRSSTSWAADQTLVCVGSAGGQGYPMGKSPTRSTTLVIILNHDPALTQVALGYNKVSPICRPKETKFDDCKATQDEDTLDVTNVTQMIFTSLQLDKRTGKLNYASGGMDGGWDFQGICKAK